jgi:hypothetical protein
MQAQRLGEMPAAMRQYASGHGHAIIPAGNKNVQQPDASSGECTDNLVALIASIKRMPGFHGVRMQQMALYALGKVCWDKTHQTPYSNWPNSVPYVDKRQAVYHRPNELRLDVLINIVKAYAH